MDKQIPIVLCTDNNFVEYMLVTTTSILLNTTHKIKFYILTSPDLSLENKKLIKNKILKYKLAKLKIIKIEDSQYKFKINHHLPLATYYRILISKYVKEDKVIYLDGDIIVLDDIKKLYNLKLGTKVIAAVEDTAHIINSPENKRKHKELEIPAKFKYFNAGVLLINNKKYKLYKLKLINYIITNPEKIKLCDQDALNAILYNKTKIINLKYNMTWHFYLLKYITNYYDLRTIKNNKPPLIFHFAGSIKPWQHRYFGPYLKEFKQFYLITFNKEIKYNKNYWKKLKQYLKLKIISNNIYKKIKDSILKSE